MGGLTPAAIARTLQRQPMPMVAPPLQVFSLAGGALNVLRIPERWLQPEDPKQPAPLDLFCNSHQVGACVWDCGACGIAVRVLRCLPDATTDLHGRR